MNRAENLASVDGSTNSAASQETPAAVSTNSKSFFGRLKQTLKPKSSPTQLAQSFLKGVGIMKVNHISFTQKSQRGMEDALAERIRKGHYEVQEDICMATDSTRSTETWEPSHFQVDDSILTPDTQKLEEMGFSASQIYKAFQLYGGPATAEQLLQVLLRMPSESSEALGIEPVTASKATLRTRPGESSDASIPLSPTHIHLTATSPYRDSAAAAQGRAYTKQQHASSPPGSDMPDAAFVACSAVGSAEFEQAADKSMVLRPSQWSRPSSANLRSDVVTSLKQMGFTTKEINDAATAVDKDADINELLQVLLRQDARGPEEEDEKAAPSVTLYEAAQVVEMGTEEDEQLEVDPVGESAPPLPPPSTPPPEDEALATRDIAAAVIRHCIKRALGAASHTEKTTKGAALSCANDSSLGGA